MKIVRMGEPQTVMSNPESRHNYFGWPSIARLQNGKIAVAASGFRLRHICPFGKTVISYSEDDGETYTAPAPVIDTVLDDRDGGIVPFGEKGVIVTSFNNSVEFQRRFAASSYDLGYLELITPQEEQKALGATFRISNDCGVTFGEIHKSPVTSPHGPAELPDGTLLWVGRTFSPKDEEQTRDCIQAFQIAPDGSMTYVGEIENIKIGDESPLSCEPHTIVLDDGTILAHIRVQLNGEKKLFTIYQSSSNDNGKTWTKPEPVLPRLGGSPPHLFRHSSGMLICTYGYREAPFGIKAMFSSDGGKTWDTGNDIYINNVNGDLGYPSTIELRDGSLLTVFYAHQSEDQPAVIMQQKWRFEDEI